MRTLLILGSKPKPALPPSSSFNDLACANASGFSAAQHGLPIPKYTVISAILTSGIGSGKQSLSALHGLETKTLYFFPRPHKSDNHFKRFLNLAEEYRTSAFYFQRSLRKASYHWQHFVKNDYAWYRGLVDNFCSSDPSLLAQTRDKGPSTGIMTLLICLEMDCYERVILSGFSFELTHAYANNPEIKERGTIVSRHTPTDIRVLQHLSARLGNIFTTENIVSERADVPLLSA